MPGSDLAIQIVTKIKTTYGGSWYVHLDKFGTVGWKKGNYALFWDSTSNWWFRKKFETQDLNEKLCENPNSKDDIPQDLNPEGIKEIYEDVKRIHGNSWFAVTTGLLVEIVPRFVSRLHGKPIPQFYFNKFIIFKQNCLEQK